MNFLPATWWLTALLALVLFSDVAMSIRPFAFIRDCLDGVNFPRDWWWTLIVIKMLAVTGLVTGMWVPGVAFAANVGVVVYFCCAAVAHIRADNLGQAFWINCLGMLGLSLAVLVLSFAL